MFMSALSQKLRLLSDIFLRADGRITAPYESVTIELTSFCNLSCPLCPVAKDANTLTRERQLMSRADLQRIVDLTKFNTRAYVLSMWGEPLLHKDFFELLDIVRAAGKIIWISTNLNYTRRFAERMAMIPELQIICSLDGWDEKSYLAYRVGGRFDRVRDNLAVLARGKCRVYPQFLVNDGNRRDVAKMLAFCDSFDIPVKNVKFPEMQYNFRNDQNEVISGHCHQPYVGAYFNSDGYMLPCCVNVGPDLKLPHVSRFETTNELRNGADVTAMRRQLAKDKNHYGSCTACRGLQADRAISSSLVARIRGVFQAHRIPKQ
jgi:sulfatase maturation enzyme AslB (radical SAM superfamily)